MVRQTARQFKNFNKLIKTAHFFCRRCALFYDYLLTTIIAIYSEKNKWQFQVRKNKKLVIKSELVRYGAPFIISMGITTFFQATDKIFLNYYCTYTEVGIYSSAMSLVHIFAIIQSTLNAVWVPMSIEHYEKNPDDKGFYQKANQIITVIMYFIGINLIFVKDFFAIL